MTKPKEARESPVPPLAELEGTGGPSEPDRRARRRSSFAGDVLRLVSGTSVAQLITVLSSPIVTRLFAPEAFGLWALFGSITSVIGIVVCLRYELAIMLPEADEEAANLLALSLLLALGTSVATIPAVIFGGQFAARLLKAPALEGVLWAVPPTVLGAGVVVALNYWNSRARRFGRLSTSRVAASAMSTAVQLGAGWSGHANAGGLVASSLAGSAVSVGVLGSQVLRDDGAFFRRSVRWRGIRESLQRHRKFPTYGTTTALLNSASWQLPSILLQYYFSATVVGLYAMGNQLLRVPMNLIGGAISQVFYQQAVEAHRTGRLADVVESAFRRLAAFSLFPMVVLAVVGREIFLVVLGPRWGEAGVYAQILSLWTFFWFISSPLTTLFAVLERQEFALKINAAILGTRFLSLVVGGLLGSARLALTLFAATGVLAYGFLTLAVLSASGLSLGRAGKILLRNLALAAPAAGILVGLKLLGTGLFVPVAAAALLLGAYFLHLARTDPQIASRLGRLPFFGRRGKMAGSES